MKLFSIIIEHVDGTDTVYDSHLLGEEVEKIIWSEKFERYIFGSADIEDFRFEEEG